MVRPVSRLSFNKDKVMPAGAIVCFIVTLFFDDSSSSRPFFVSSADSETAH